MTVTKKHSTRRPLQAANATAEQARARNSVLREQFPSRAAEVWWPATGESAEDVRCRLTAAPFLPAAKATAAGRRRGVTKVLDWLSSLPGDSWQERWTVSGAEDLLGVDWTQLPLRLLSQQAGPQPSYVSTDLSTGLLVLVGGDVIRPSMPWMLTRTHRHLATIMAEARDPDGFGQLAQMAASQPHSSKDAQIAATRIAIILACKGGLIRDITVGDCVELFDTQRRVHVRGGQHKVDFYLRLRTMGVFADDAPATIRAFGQALGQLSIEELVDRYPIQCRPIRDLLVEYLRERQPSLDFASLDAVSRTLAGLFWARIEALSPGINTLLLPPALARAWKEDLSIKRRTTAGPDGATIEIASPRLNAKDELMRVRAFYLDLAHWAAEEPGRWGPWVVRCPISDDEIRKVKERKHRKARMDQRTRERLPVLPVLVSTANRRRLAAAELLRSAQATEPGAAIPGTEGSLRRAVTTKAAGHLTWAEETLTGRRRNLSFEEEEAFWAFAAVEVLRLTGIRNEELLELSHHSITEYRLPTTGEIVPLLQIAPSKTDTERLLLVSPELADVLCSIVRRLRGAAGAIPLAPFYDVREKVWNPPMPLLFQRQIGTEHRAFTPTFLRTLLIGAIACTGLTDAGGTPLTISPHDFRRIFVTDAIMNGLPPHIAQVICGHKNIDTTMGYKAVYPAETIKAHRAFIARRRATRPSEEYRTPTNDEWDAFLAHFEKRKVSVGTCGRAFSTPCVHEHACVRCSLLRPDPAQRARIEEIRDNLTARIAEAEHEGWLGEVEGLRVSLAGAEDKLAQLDRTAARRTTIDLGMPTPSTGSKS